MKAEPSESDRERLRAARGGAPVDPSRSLFGPESLTWRVTRESLVLLGGGRALLLQVAHPLVAAGVSKFSDFRAHPLRRLWRTLDLMLTLVFSSAARAIEAVREIERIHSRVHGTLEVDTGPFARGTPYRAGDPALLYWVYATLFDTALLVYERFVAPFDEKTRFAYYEESKIGARLFGIPEAFIPRTYGDFRDYFDAMIEGDTLTVGAEGREIAESILHPPLPIGLRHAVRLTALISVGLLPPPLRRRYGLTWSPRRERAIGALAASTRSILPILPDLLRSLPHARRCSLLRS
ncbi:MAG: oxygenase MpaB family protein [Vicinamibacteria bacterium]